MPDGRTAFSIFQIVQPVSPQPTPSITRTVPTAVVFGGIGSKLEIIGQGFVPGSIVLTNGTPNQTVVIMSNSHLQIQLSGIDQVAFEDRFQPVRKVAADNHGVDFVVVEEAAHIEIR